GDRTRRARQDGRQHGRAAPPRRPHGGGLRPERVLPPGREQPGGARPEARQAAGDLGDGPLRRPDAGHRAGAQRAAGVGRRRGGRRQLPLHRRPGARGHAQGEGHRLRRRRRLRRRLGPAERLRPDGRWRRGERGEGAARVRHVEAVGGRVRARRLGRRGPLLQDGPQRHRVRDHAGVRRGLRAPRDLRPGHRGAGRVPQLDPGHRHPVLAAGPAGPRPGRGPGPAQDPRLGRGLRRGPVDAAGRDRARGADAGDRGGAVRPVRQPAGRLAGDEGRGRAAQPVRRARDPVRGRADPRDHAGAVGRDRAAACPGHL
ncbi:MAG: 6-phosphogluconate dehydrogenase, decarboxylating, partial [uncultured Corynebacteriales bacterium]